MESNYSLKITQLVKLYADASWWLDNCYYNNIEVFKKPNELNWLWMFSNK